MLFRFLRGSGTAGLAGIRPVTAEGMVRPLIEVDRREVESFLRERGIAWREDSSNRSLEFARNRIRHELLPQLAREWNPALAETLAHTADWALAEEAYWEAEIDRLAAGRLTERHGAVLLRAGDLAGLPLAAARRLVRRAMERAKGDLRGVDFDHVGAVLELAAAAEGHGQVQAPGLEIVRSFEWLRLAPPGESGMTYEVPAPVPGVVRIPGSDVAIALELIEKPETSGPVNTYMPANTYIMVAWVVWTGPVCPVPCELRNWRPGDRYQPSRAQRRGKDQDPLSRGADSALGARRVAGSDGRSRHRLGAAVWPGGGFGGGWRQPARCCGFGMKPDRRANWNRESVAAASIR